MTKDMGKGLKHYQDTLKAERNKAPAKTTVFAAAAFDVPGAGDLAAGDDAFMVGVISDTHGLLRPYVPHIFQECDLIIHSGDIGKPAVLESLGALAPVVAVRGNVDRGGWAAGIPLTRIVEIANKHIYILHDLDGLDLDPGATGIDMVISGHSHKPAEFRRGGVQYLNPGSAGPRRFNLPISAALMCIDEETIGITFISLPDINIFPCPDPANPS